MKVVLIKIDEDGPDNLTLGKVYEAEVDEPHWYRIVDDNGRMQHYFKERFREADPTELVKLKVFQLESIPAEANPFHHDAFHMGVKLGTNVMVMQANHATEECKYLIIINLETGTRHRISLKE